jgi:hypothetical protein
MRSPAVLFLTAVTVYAALSARAALAPAEGVRAPAAPAVSAPVPDQAMGDTSVVARRGDVLALDGFSGHIDIRAGGSDRVEVTSSRSDRSDRSGIRVSRAGGRLVIGDRDPKGRALDRRVEVVVPAWLDVDLRGFRLDVGIRGLRSRVTVNTVEGDITVDDGEGELDVSTVTGNVRVSDFAGRLRANSLSDDVRLVRITGSVWARSTDGDVIMDDVDTSELEAQTVDGDVEFRGRLRSGGSLRLVTHDGDVIAELPRDIGAEVSVSTFDGSFSADFPVHLERFSGGREMRFTLGDGAGRLVLQAFDGAIRLRYAR